MAEGPEGKPGRRHRRLSEEERRLWRAVVKDAKPLSGKRLPSEIPPESGEEPQTPQKVSNSKRIVPYNSGIVTNDGPEPIGPPPLNRLDRRTSQRLARGQVEAEARLDLHGFGREEARLALLYFLVRSRADGLRCVLVITGKGESPFSRHTLHGANYHQATEHSGVLRSALPVWLEESSFRREVAGFQPAHPRHGGGGAFYLWLRKRKP